MTCNKLDQLVAKEVMGYKWWRSSSGCVLTKAVGLDSNCWTPIDAPDDDEDVYADHDLPTCPSFSTDIKAAWRVVEEMRKRGFDSIVNSGAAGKTPDGWDGPCRACFSINDLNTDSICLDYADPEHGNKYYDHECESFPEAICVAALLASGVKIGDSK